MHRVPETVGYSIENWLRKHHWNPILTYFGLVIGLICIGFAVGYSMTNKHVYAASILFFMSFVLLLGGAWHAWKTSHALKWICTVIATIAFGIGDYFWIKSMDQPVPWLLLYINSHLPWALVFVLGLLLVATFFRRSKEAERPAAIPPQEEPKTGEPPSRAKEAVKTVGDHLPTSHAPKVILEYHWQKDKHSSKQDDLSMPVTLRNEGEETASNVQIEEIKSGPWTIRFDLIPHLHKGEPKSIQANIQYQNFEIPSAEHHLIVALKPLASENRVESKTTRVDVSYQDFSGATFVSEYEFRWDQEKEEANAYLLRYGKKAAQKPHPTQESLPASRPIVVPIRYGKITSGPEAGHSGISLRNDGEPAYSVSAHSVTLAGLGTIQMDGTPQQLRQGEPEISFPSWRQSGNSSSLGSGLYYFMVENKLDSITIPVTYRDANFKWYQTDVILIKNQMARSVEGSESGIQIDWAQKAIPSPDTHNSATYQLSGDLAQRIFTLCKELKQFLRDLGPARQETFRSDMSLEQFTEENKDLFTRSQKMEAMFIKRYRNRVIDLYNEACETGTISDAELERTLNQKIDHDAMIEKIIERLNSVGLEVVKLQQ